MSARVNTAGPLLYADPDAAVRAHVRPGMHVHCAATMSRPNALINALARVFAGGGSLTVSVASVHSNAHALALSGAVRRVITGFLGDTYPSPRPNVLYRDAAGREPFEVQAWSLLALIQRLMAGALGAPYAVTPSLAGSDLFADLGGDAFAVPVPDGDPAVLVRALTPDVTLVHGLCADRRGNVVICPPYGEGAWPALAARAGVVASVERIVPGRVIDASPGRVVIPGERVIALCEAPFGAHPQSLSSDGTGGVPGYRDDYAFLADITRRGRSAPALRDWYRDWISGLSGHGDYLDKIGKNRLERLLLTTGAGTTAREAAGDAAGGRAPGGSGGQVTDQRCLVVLAARTIADLVQREGYSVLLAGIGASHLACWTAERLLRDRGVRVQVCAELGFYGTAAAPGDVYLFGQAHARRSQALLGTVEVLGGLVAGSHGRCLGVLGAAQVDRAGNVNTSRLADGRRLTGSGGANDIASSADCVVVAAATPRRYVERVDYVTSPGRRVRAVVSQFGRFVRDEPGGPFRLDGWLRGDRPLATAAADVAAHTAWSVATDACALEEPPTARELALVDDLDPEGIYR